MIEPTQIFYELTLTIPNYARIPNYDEGFSFEDLQKAKVEHTRQADIPVRRG